MVCNICLHPVYANVSESGELVANQYEATNSSLMHKLRGFLSYRRQPVAETELVHLEPPQVELN
jgi:hypothetical protein